MVRGVYIIGTDTEVGKTVVAAGLMTLLSRRGLRAAYFKPVSSGQIEDETGLHPADAFFVQRISGVGEKEEIVSPFAYREAVAPHLAARWEARPILRQKIKNSLAYLKEHYEVIVAEAAGGLAVPLNEEGFMQYDLISELGFACLLVARAGLGTINHTLLTLHLARDKGLSITALFINQYQGLPLEVENVSVLRHLTGLKNIYVIPPLSALETEQILPVFDRCLTQDDLNSILKPLPHTEKR